MTAIFAAAGLTGLVALGMTCWRHRRRMAAALKGQGGRRN